MKVLAVIMLVVASAAARGSGPYLPSGWRPSGPAFYLPGEAQETSTVPLKDVVQEEAAGSDFLREYGPPKLEEVSQDITVQRLPETVTDQAFVVIEAKFNQEDQAAGQLSEETTEDSTAAVDESTTESQALIEEKITIAEVEPIAQGKALDTQTVVEEVSQVTTEERVDVAQQETENANSNIVAEVEEKIVAEVKTVDEGAKNIAEAIVNLENEVNAQQVQTIQKVAEIKTVQEDSGSVRAPEGLLEYGPPGFKEYGPPKEDDLLRSSLITEEKSAAVPEVNETRRRRFSPKFKPVHAKKH